jgi:gamma-glutamylcyclotransferase (GGCT)/AIG2-like uncharacterized protein YtfP
MLVAVYGTLRKGQRNNLLLNTSIFLGEDIIKESFEMYDLGHYPGVIIGNNNITVEVYDINEQILKRLDYLEGYIENNKTNLYDRIKINTKFGEAYIYIYKDSDRIKQFKTIKSGDYIKYLEYERSLT